MKTYPVFTQVCCSILVSLIFGVSLATAQQNPPPQIQIRIDQEKETCVCNEDYSKCVCCNTVATPPFFTCKIVLNGEDITDDNPLRLVLTPDGVGKSDYRPYQGDLDDADITDMIKGERQRLKTMVALGKRSKADLLSLRIRDVTELGCHVTQGGKWIKCDWPYSPNTCSQAGWIPHHDGSCCKRID